jgi:hypothetical protein
MRVTHGDTRMILTELYAHDRRRVRDTNGNSQAGLPPFFVCIVRSLHTRPLLATMVSN